MSAETIEWLNKYTLQSVAAWHTDQKIQAALAMPTVYEGPIPVEDVRSRLFGWKAVEGDVTSTGMNDDGVFTITDPDRKTILRPPGALGADDGGAVLGVFKKGYQPHNYDEWLLREVASILDDGLDIYSAGLLRGGAQAWVQVSVPDTIVTPEGVQFRPNLLAVTSFDGSLATTYKRTITNTVCDNTMGMALNEDGDTFKVRHSSNSVGKLIKARDALGLVHLVAEDFAHEVAVLCDVKVSDGDFEKFLDTIAPLADPKTGEPKEGRGLTMAKARRDEYNQLWHYDARVAPWSGTAYGVVQAVNTYAHHVQSFKGDDRAQRNQKMVISGDFDALDRKTADTILEIVG